MGENKNDCGGNLKTLLLKLSSMNPKTVMEGIMETSAISNSIIEFMDDNEIEVSKLIDSMCNLLSINKRNQHNLNDNQYELILESISNVMSYSDILIQKLQKQSLINIISLLKADHLKQQFSLVYHILSIIAASSDAFDEIIINNLNDKLPDNTQDLNGYC